MPAPLFDDLLALTCFARVVERRSFTRAAEALGVSKSVVSARVAELEARLGERLLVRTTRKLTVTDAGLNVYAQAARMLEAATTATAGATDVGKGLIRVDAPITLAQMYLAEPLARFLRDDPEARVHLFLNDRLVDLVEERVDVAIRVTKLEGGGLVVRRLASTSLHIVGSPAYLAERGTPERPEDLLHHECIRYALLRPEEEWRLYGVAGRIRVPIRARLESTNGTMIREAAIAGLGLAILPRFMIHRALREGTLVTVLEDFAPRPLGIYAVQLERRVRSPRIKAFLDALAHAFKPEPWR